MQINSKKDKRTLHNFSSLPSSVFKSSSWLHFMNAIIGSLVSNQEKVHIIV
jgi:hypothetical protein